MVWVEKRETLPSATTGHSQDGSQLRDVLTGFGLGPRSVACLHRPFLSNDFALLQDFISNDLKLIFFNVCDATKTIQFLAFQLF